ncbi:ribosomal RNA small subunit methyltransferase J [Bacterioplanes sanyensis]|uniref:class I SAM-dependent methyltransferase n=1 Tax=Bacterioplanes sanyensis TaxID=1249553 RepID=UPI001678627B|nr:class I SAM-dependent methyltransferase [Bacterioplanes sanyensis]GGY45052.1 ribosomal RNA small subunit methyltransferase J [Bacterioplanes sanyensis]
MTWLICGDSSLWSCAQQIAHYYQLKVNSDWPTEAQEYQLLLDHSGLSLARSCSDKSRVQVDFCGGANDHRRRFGGGKGQDIAKAVGVASYVPQVADLTAGLGRDAFVLASLGCRVQALERHPVVAALLADGLARAGNAQGEWPLSYELPAEEVRQIAQRIRLQHIGAAQWLAQQRDDSIDVVYLDPMFAHDGRQKAQVKKDMQAFRSLVGSDDDADELLAEALRVARCRCVVKRARKAAPLAQQQPTYELVGKANRFDVYAKRKVEAPH